jgi:outer membrane receptor protein involved in Fe transport
MCAQGRAADFLIQTAGWILAGRWGRRSGRTRLLFLCSALLVPPRAGAAGVDFRIPAESAADALLAFSRQANADVLFPFDELAGARANALQGRLEPAAALAQLLRGTGFAARATEAGKFVVTPAGAITGRLLAPDRVGARGIRVAIVETGQTARTDDNGDFSFAALAPGVYRLVATGAGFDPLQLPETTVEARRVATLPPQMLQTANDLIRLEAVVVEGQSDQVGRPGAGQSGSANRTAGGNLDLPRTPDDALEYEVYTRDQIIRGGTVNLDEFLQRELLDSEADTQDLGSGNSSGLFSGSSNLNLRGYGNDETVILVNGRRLPDILTGGVAPWTAAPDVDLIPVSLVERIEVLPLSASALYNGNPIGGVINIVLRADAEKNTTEVTTTYTNALRRFDAPQTSLSMLNLQSLAQGKVHLRLDASFTDSLPPTEQELGYHQANRGPPPALGAGVDGATPNVSSLADPVSAILPPLFGPGTSPVTSVAPGADGTGGLAAFAGRQGERDLAFYSSYGGLSTSTDSLGYAYGERERRSVFFASADWDAAPWLQVGVDGTYARTVINPGYSVVTGNLTLGATSPFNPFGQEAAVSLNETTPQLGAGYNQAQLQFASAVLGLVCKLPDSWKVTLDGQYSADLAQYRAVAGADPVAWQQLVDQGIYNPLRDTQVFGPPAQFYDQVLIYEGGRGDFVTLGDYRTLDLAARATNQALALPTGPGTLNLGADYRRDQFGNLSEPLVYGDGASVGPPDTFTGRILQEYSLFGELQAPALPVARLPWWLHHADADLAVRYDAGAESSETNVAPTLALKLDGPGGVSLRGSVTTSNRFPTPSLSQESAGAGLPAGDTTATPITIDDPVRNQTYAIASANQLNPVLHAEEAVTQSVGLLFERGSVRRLRLTLDFVDTIKHDEEAYLNPQEVLDLEPLLPGRVIRAPLAPGDPHAVGPVTFIETGAVNIDLRRSQNLNATFDYDWNQCAGGTLEMYARMVYFLSYDRQILPDSPLTDELRDPDGSAPDLLRLRANFGTSWSNRRYGVGLDGHYFDSRILPADEWPFQGSDQIGRYWQFDSYVQADAARWLPWKSEHFGLKAQLRVNNIFGWSYPYYGLEPSGAGVEPYGDWRGRTYSLSLTASF